MPGLLYPLVPGVDNPDAGQFNGNPHIFEIDADALGAVAPNTAITGGSRSFIEDNDTLTLRGAAQGQGYSIGFGECMGRVLPALNFCGRCAESSARSRGIFQGGRSISCKGEALRFRRALERIWHVCGK